MALYAIGYDLVKRKDYPKLWEEFERLGAHKPVESVYLLNVTNDDPEAIKQHFSQFIDEDDRLIVIPFSGRPRPRFTKAFTGTTAWINENCP